MKNMLYRRPIPSIQHGSFSKECSLLHGAVVYLNEKNEEVICTFIWNTEKEAKEDPYKDSIYIGRVTTFVRRLKENSGHRDFNVQFNSDGSSYWIQ